MWKYGWAFAVPPFAHEFVSRSTSPAGKHLPGIGSARSEVSIAASLKILKQMPRMRDSFVSSVVAEVRWNYARGIAMEPLSQKALYFLRRKHPALLSAQDLDKLIVDGHHLLKRS